MSLYKKIANEIESMIKESNLTVGSRLPSVRTLCEHFNASSCTVYNSLEELKYKGIIESKPRLGYFVSYDGWNTLFPNTPDWDKYNKMGWLRERTSESDFFQEAKTLSLSGFGTGEHLGAPHYLKKVMERLFSNSNPFLTLDKDYRGSLSLRQTLCEHMLRYGVKAEPDEMLITAGVFNSLSLIKLGFMRTGMEFLCDNCFTPKVNASYSSLGINKINLSVDSDGVIPEKLAQTLQKNRQSILCSTFGGMSPYADDKSFGVSSISRKRNILKLCNATRTPIIEVDNYRDLFLGPAPQPIKSIDSANSVLYIGSLTKSFMTTFRLGWIIGPKKVITKLADLRMQLEGGQNAVLQKIAEELISSGLYYDYLDNLNSQIRRDTPEITSFFEKYLTGIASWNLNPIGRSAYIRFIDDIDIHKMYENKGSFQFTPGYIMDNEWEQYVPISVITEPLELLAEGLSRLADLAKNSLR